MADILSFEDNPLLDYNIDCFRDALREIFVLKDGKVVGNGGAFVLPSFPAKLHLKRSTVRDCEATDDGGAVHMKNGAVLVMEESTLTSNKANMGGGGLSARYGAKVVIVEGKTSHISNNTVSDGDGAVSEGVGDGVVDVSDGVVLDGHNQIVLFIRGMFVI
jgi:hypothetical protein